MIHGLMLKPGFLLVPTRGIVTNITDYSAFVELEAGVEGLVHVSEMSWTKKCSPRKDIIN